MIILASASPRRQELLSMITPEFKVIPSNADETVPEGFSVIEAVEYLSKIKAESVTEDGIIIGADTVVAIDGKMLGKPKDEQDAFLMLSYLSGRTHEVYTGVTVISKDKEVTFSEKTEVEFFPLTDLEIKEYIKTKEPLDKAGSYGIQGMGAMLVKGICGDYNNVIGLPISRLKRVLEQL